MANPPTERIEVLEYTRELVEIRRQFGLGERDPIPANIFYEKSLQWFRTVNQAEIAHLYYPCSHPDCANKIEHWMLIEDFERDYRDQGRTIWYCAAGHSNCVLPSDQEINDMNRNILSHPEYYTARAYYDNCPLRRYRICPKCLDGGTLMLAVHGGNCKQWPGSGAGRGHQHCFCFACTRAWGEHGGCSHQSTDCKDPGVQQVRKSANGLEMGYIDGEAYIEWLRSSTRSTTANFFRGRRDPPPTVFPSETIDGYTWQRIVGMPSIQVQLEEIGKGTE